MLGFDEQLTAKGCIVLKLFKQAEDRCIGLVRYPDGSDAVWRCYDRPVPSYEKLIGIKCDELPEVYRYISLECGGCLVEEEFVDGILLGELVSDHRLDEPQTAAITHRICKALAVLHGLDMVHRDVKPENIIVTSKGRVVLIDLDAVSPRNSEKDRDTRLLGTVGYAAPEQYGFGHSDGRADLFGVGVLMNVLLTGRHPARQLADGTLKKVIEKCIAINVDQRYDTVVQLMEQLPKTEDKYCTDCGFLSPGGGCIFCGKSASRGQMRRGRSILWIMAMVLIATMFVAGIGIGRSTRGTVDTSSNDIDNVSADTKAELPINTLEQPQQQIMPEVLPSQQPMLYVEESRPIYSGEEPNAATAFAYDLNGDGTEEEYYFGFLLDNTGKPVFYTRDIIQYNPGESGYVLRKVAPAVWKCDQDGNFVLEEKFADLIKMPKVSVYSYRSADTLLAVQEIGNFQGWNGAVEVKYDYGKEEMWVLKATCMLGENELSSAILAVVAAKAEQAPVKKLMCTDGEPIEPAHTVSWKTKDEMVVGEYTIYDCTIQRLDNEHIRYAVDYVCPKGLRITVFDPPNGGLFRFSDESGTSGEREQLVFDMPEEMIAAAGKLTIIFNAGTGNRFMVFF